MINVSGRFKQELYNNNRNYIISANIVAKDLNGDSVTLSVSNSRIMQGGFQLDDAVSDDYEFAAVGSAIINSAELILNNMDDLYSVYDFTNAACVVQVGLQWAENGTAVQELHKKFTGFVDSPTYQSSTITLSILDNMTKFNKAYDTNLVYPTTLGVALSDACQKCGVTLDSSVSLPSAISNFVLSKKPDSESTTYLDVIGYLATIAGCFARCNTDGKLELKWFDIDSLDSYTDTIDGGIFDANSPYSTGDAVDGGTFDPWNTGDEVDGGSLSSATGVHNITGLKSQTISIDDIIISGVKVIVTDDDEDATTELPEYTHGTSDYMIEISDNPFITKTNAQTVADYLGTLLEGIKFRSANLSHLSDPTIEAGDVAIVWDRKGRAFPILITRTTFYVSSPQQTISAAKTVTRNTSVQISRAVKTYVETRKNMKAVENDLNQKIAGINGMYETRITDPGTGATITYLHNRVNRLESDVQIVISDVGILVTNDGINYPTPDSSHWFGLIVDGTLISNILNTNGVNANWINTGALKVYDANDNPIFTVDVTNHQFSWDVPYSVLSTDGELTLIDPANNAAFRIVDDKNELHRLYIAELYSDQLNFSRVSVANTEYGISHIHLENASSSSLPPITFEVLPTANSSGTGMIINGKSLDNWILDIIQAEYVATPEFTPASGITVVSSDIARHGKICTVGLTIKSNSAISSSTVVGTLTAMPQNTVIGHARTSSVLEMVSINANGQITVTPIGSINANVNIYISITFAVYQTST